MRSLLIYMSARIYFFADNLHYEKFQDGSVKCIEDEIPFDLPDGWAWCRLNILFNVCSSKRVLQSEWKTEGIPFYRAREIVKLSDNGYVENELFISEDHFLSLSREYGVPQPGDLMVSGVGTIGKIYIVNQNDRFYYKDASVLCFENRTGNVISEFARILLESSFIQKQMRDNSKGTTVDTITISTAMNYLCILPPLEEQKRIIDTSQTALACIGDMQKDKESLQTILATAKSKILDLAIRGQLIPQDLNDEPASVLLERIRAEKEELIKQGKIKRDKKESFIFKGEDNSYYEKIGVEIRCIDAEIPFEIPDGWTYERLGNICSVARGGSPRPIENYLTDENNGLNWIKIGDTEQGGKYIFSTREKIRPEGLSKTRYVHCGDFLLTNSMSFGRPYILKTDGCIHDGWLVISDVETLFDQDFLYYMLSSSAMYNALSSLAVGSTVKNLKSDSVKSLIVPIPPIREQKLIADRVEMLFMVTDQIEKSLR